MFYNKQGNEISLEEWNTLSSDWNYKCIKQEVLSNKKFISTVWIGLDYINNIETMVFPKEGSYIEEECQTYSNEREALKGHKNIHKKWTNL